MSDDLIKRLRVTGNGLSAERLEYEDADRIEELEAKLAEAEAVAKIWREDFIQENNRWCDALRKLAKVMEIGDKMAASIKGNYYIPNVVAEWNAVLAELEGEPLGAEFEAVWDANKTELYEP